MKNESENVEFKSKLTDDIYKEIIAFANTDGGVVYVGIDDQGNICGLDDIDETYTKLTNGIRDAIHPDVTMFIRYFLQNREVIKIEVGEGSYKPYYLKSKGIKPSGVYVRQGTSSVQASWDMIRRMIRDSDRESYETQRSMEQELTFESAKRMFDKYHVDFSEIKYRALGLKDEHTDEYTNLALLLSDQCKHTVKVAVFSDLDNSIFRDAKEFKGSVFEQMEQAFAYLQLCNKTLFRFSGLERIEHIDYPEDALREALLNAVVHRDYGFSGSIIINVNETKMEFISIGGLMPGLTQTDICNGISQPRNPKLAEIFHRLKLIESYGTGIQKILRLYSHCDKQPEFVITDNTFKLILPNQNACQNQSI